MKNRFNSIIILHIALSIMFANQDAIIANKSSFIPLQLHKKTSPIFHVGSLNDSLLTKPMFGVQIQPTHNLIINGTLSPQSIDNNLCLYYNTILGYIPRWNINQNLSSVLQFGIHNYKFSKTSDIRWFNFSITELLNINFVTIKLSWSKLFNKQWERNTVLVSTKINIYNFIMVESGILTYFSPNINFIPCIFISTHI